MNSNMELHNAEIYGPELADQIAAQGRYTVDVANRWMLGWPSRVRAMLDGKVYFEWLKGQVCTEKDVLASEPSAQHLSEREILEMHEVQLAPPAMCDDPRFAAFARGEVVVEDLGGLQILKDRQRKDAEEVRAGLRSARSLWVVGEGDLDGATFTENPNSEFNRRGEGWGPTQPLPPPQFVTKTTLAEHFEMKPGDTLTAILSRRPKPPGR